jgi:hypothetical protein
MILKLMNESSALLSGFPSGLRPSGPDNSGDSNKFALLDGSETGTSPLMLEEEVEETVGKIESNKYLYKPTLRNSI